MKVIAFNGSARKNGNTAKLINFLFEELEKEGISTELIQLAASNIHGCRACRTCFKNKNKKCAFEDDDVNNYIEKMLDADAIILASPVYFANMSTELKALIDRIGFVARANDNMLRRKVGACVISARRAGAVFTHDAINHFFFISEMVVPGSSYWNLSLGDADKEGESTMRQLGKNMAWLMKCIEKEK
ncbi:flavodoxin family protein [Candidatus Woesearchaeota archaeon]|nr:flavodoxin family protein [Candidatus Woesearchaeota archaeon]